MSTCKTSPGSNRTRLSFPNFASNCSRSDSIRSATTLAHVLGYVGEISPKQLEEPEYKEKGFRPGDIIGKGGLEQYYDEYLRGRPGYRKVIVDSRRPRSERTRGRSRNPVKTW